MRSVEFSPDGKMLACGLDDGTIKLWNVETRTEIKTLRDHGLWVSSAKFRPDGKMLASGLGEGTMEVSLFSEDLFSEKSYNPSNKK